jgi:hypothetical protein
MNTGKHQQISVWRTPLPPPCAFGFEWQVPIWPSPTIVIGFPLISQPSGSSTKCQLCVMENVRNRLLDARSFFAGAAPDAAKRSRARAVDWKPCE